MTEICGISLNSAIRINLLSGDVRCCSIPFGERGDQIAPGASFEV